MDKAGRVLFLLVAAVVLVLITIWLIGLGDDYHYANPSAREGLGGRILFIGQFALSVLPALIAWQCLRAAWQLITTPTPVKAQASPSQTEDDTSVPMSDDERFALEAAQVGERRRSESEEVFRKNRTQLADAHAKLSRAKQLVDESGVGFATLKILRLSWRSPDAAELQDWEPDSTTEGTDSGYQKSGMAWKWGGKRFGIKLTQHPSYGLSSNKIYGDIVVWADDAEVLKLDVSMDAASRSDHWDYIGVSGLKPGDWMPALVDFCGELELIDSNAHAESQRRYYEGKAVGIELPTDNDQP
ncbi:MAG: hypothetical protein K2P70_02140 [Hyphomonadaceae bacterium]|nr:hypothetical protein [Hyphomonadaceae bacterium]